MNIQNLLDILHRRGVSSHWNASGAVCLSRGGVYYVLQPSDMRVSQVMVDGVLSCFPNKGKQHT